jgi:hypothetical protein
MNVNIRTATSTDVPQLCKLYYDFHEFHAAEVPERLKGLGPWEEFDTTQLSSDLLGSSIIPRLASLLPIMIEYWPALQRSIFARMSQTR